jgi:hypothetical protein
MITFQEIDGTPVYYWRSSRPNTRPVNWRCTQAYHDQLVLWMRDLRTLSADYGTVSFIASAGFYVNKPGQHGAGSAMDLDHVEWSSGTVCTPLDRHHKSGDRQIRRRYLAVDAVCRRRFRYVLNGWYNAAHADHIHSDFGGLPVRCLKGASSDVKFVQAVCNNFLDAGLTVDGAWGARTQNAFTQAKTALGITGDPHTSTSVWQTMLSGIAEHGFADKAF